MLLNLRCRWLLDFRVLQSVYSDVMIEVIRLLKSSYFERQFNDDDSVLYEWHRLQRAKFFGTDRLSSLPAFSIASTGSWIHSEHPKRPWERERLLIVLLSSPEPSDPSGLKGSREMGTVIRSINWKKGIFLVQRQQQQKNTNSDRRKEIFLVKKKAKKSKHIIRWKTGNGNLANIKVRLPFEHLWDFLT